MIKWKVGVRRVKILDRRGIPGWCDGSNSWWGEIVVVFVQQLMADNTIFIWFGGLG